MASLIPGYEYDIFISYRQKDNKYGGWVTKFVANLKCELEATFKEEISIYFDINPYDGLLETHDVDASLKEKLKSLIFIPIISQTYCDVKSFAYLHELCTFNAHSKEDQFGRDIKLKNGNVASRIIPVRIHDLDPDDKALLEKELGGVLRGVEFIFTSPGVNRPLTATDKREENSNKTSYRDQVNKVANAIKDIISSIKNPSVQPEILSKQPEILKKPSERKQKKKKKFIISFIIFSFAILSISIFLYLKLAPSAKEKIQTDNSIAVLSFNDMSPDKDQEYLGDGMAEEIINSLSKIKDLKIIGRTSSFSFKGRNIDLKTIGKTLGCLDHFRRKRSKIGS